MDKSDRQLMAKLQEAQSLLQDSKLDKYGS